ncbi:MAG: PEP-CTERM sorting domain-containing protein [Crocosphaera sp.]|nr:PEP-CTERM sorting domain-containing protein [Crocosphaera sp.]
MLSNTQSLGISLGSLLSVGVSVLISSPVQASLTFSDDFNDGIVNSSIYRPLGNANLSESLGLLNTQLLSDGDGLEIFLEDIPDSEWITMNFRTSEFSSGQELNFSIFSDSSVDAIPEFTASLVFEETVTQGTSCTLKFFVDLGDGNRRVIPYIFNQSCSLFLSGTFRIDWDGEKWQYDFGTAEGNTNDIPDIIHDAITTFPNPEDKDKKIKKVFVRFVSSTNEDPFFSLDSFDAKEIHTPVPEPTSILSLLSLGILGAGATLKRKLKPSNSIEK